MEHTREDVEVMARTIWAEARGEPFLGQIAVGWVIRTRAEIGGWWGDTIQTVCQAPSQFSCWFDDQKDKLLAVTQDNKNFRLAYAAAVLVLSGEAKDPTHSSTHYYAHKVIDKPNWALSMTATVVIGGHSFFREDHR